MVLRIAVAQLNPTVGDIAGNLAKAREARADAARQGADLVLYTELFLAGYPPEDLVVRPAFLKACEKAATGFCRGHRRWWSRRHHRHAAEAQKRHPQFGDRGGRRQGDRRALQGRPAELRRVRREARLRQGRRCRAGEFPRRALGMPICEDIWGDLGVCECAGRKRRRDPAGAQRLALLSRQDRRAHHQVADRR
jgi:NAD+ synthase